MNLFLKSFYLPVHCFDVCGTGVLEIEFIIDTSCSKCTEHMYHTEMCTVLADHLHRYHILFQT